MEKIDISSKISEFEKHLELNKRTIFSARFGDGKTYFLKEYMAHHQIWKDYTPQDERIGSVEDTYFIVLRPINYVVAKNEDIFEYIKHDILIQLYSEGKIDSIDYKAAFKAIAEVATGNLLPVIGDLIATLPSGPIVKDFVKLGKEIKKKYQEKEKSITTFLSGFAAQKGGLYEKDAYTQLIKTTLSHFKDRAGAPARKVLIIEDMDRLDPGHLFRILNVLGAHIDEEGEGNKFGFDNIILVLDYEATEHIFKHFYGKEANYEGYMNKFISSNRYHYSITEFARDHLLDYFKNICHVPDAMMHATLYDILNADREILSHVTLDSYINQMSIRDVCRVLDNVGNNIKDGLVKLNSGYKIPARNGLTLFLSALICMNVRYNIDAIFEDVLYDNEVVLFLGNFVLATPDIIRTSIRTQNKRLAVTVNHKESFDEVKIFETVDNAPIRISTKEIVYNAFNAAIPCVSECPKLSEKMIARDEIKHEKDICKHLAELDDLDHILPA